MKPTVIFDVNETLLDLSPMRAPFAALVGSADRLGEWFARMLHGSLVANGIGRYRSFGEIGTDALVALCRKVGAEASRSEAAEVVALMRSLPPHPDVIEGLTMLSEAGFPLVTLTNGSSDAVRDQVDNAGLSGFIDRSISVDDVAQFKPAPAVYLHAVAVLGVEIDEAVMVAAHDWDIVGARSVGMPGAYVNRPGAVWSLPEPFPTIVEPDIVGVARRLIAES